MKNMILFNLMVAAAVATGAVFGAMPVEKIDEPVRPIGGSQAEWNVRAKSFLYPPTFMLKDGTGYSLAEGWLERPLGWVEVKLPDGTSRRFCRKAPFRPGAYPPAARPYGDAARMAFDNLFESKQMRILRETGDIDREYPHNCYPAKMLSAAIVAMVHYAGIRPDRREAALKTAKNGADWLLAHTIKAPSPLAGFPFTYDHHPEADDSLSSAPKRISKERAHVSMNIYPCEAASAYLKLYAFVKEPRYLEGAKAICDRYLALQGEDGTWWLDQNIPDGKPIGASRVLPIDGVIPMFEEAFAATGEARYRAAADRAFGFVEKGPLTDWNWQGQFEDTPAAAKYLNQTKHPACATAIYLLKRFPGDKRRLAQARELLRFAEDQFVFWERPYTAETEPKTGFTRNRPWAGGWFTPSVTEQYSCYRPIDASAAKLIRTYLALYKAEGNPLDLAKARALGDTATRMQRPDGFIPTFWVTDPACKGDDWSNCMAATAYALEMLADFADASVRAGSPEKIHNDDILQPTTAGTVDIRVSPSEETGLVKPMNAGNNQPYILGTGDLVYEWKVCDDYRDLEIPLARTHDSRNIATTPGRMNDIALVFPDFDADENDPANYDFKLTDLYLNSIRLQGVGIMYCLGSSYDGIVNYGTDAPPKDDLKWARIVEHVIRHYNEGWGWSNPLVAYSNQFNIGWWELWNEPDLDAGEEYWKKGVRTWERRHRYWDGSPERFFEFYATASKYLKAKFPALKFGGPAMAGRTDWADRFLAHCRRSGAPIDFFSWHQYADVVEILDDKARIVRGLLDKHGYKKTLSVLDEWNWVRSWSPDGMRDDIRLRSEANNFRVAAFYAAAMSAMQHAPVDMMMQYDMRGMFNGVFQPGAEFPQKAYYAFQAWARLRKLGREVRSSVVGGELAKGVASVAARDAKGALAILVTRVIRDENVVDSVPVRIAVKGRSLAGGRLHLTDERHLYTERTLHVSPDGSATLRLAPNAFAVIELPVPDQGL